MSLNEVNCKLCGKVITEDEDYLRIRPIELIRANKPPIYSCENCITEKGGKMPMQGHLTKMFFKEKKKNKT